VVSIGGSSDQSTTFHVLKLVRTGATRLYGLSLFDELERNGMGHRELGSLLDLLATGKIDPQVGMERRWHEAGQALRALRERRVAGKAVLHID
jgi:NADPH:quinone reductase-like Zn-dependent oxidoreductase